MAAQPYATIGFDVHGVCLWGPSPIGLMEVPIREGLTALYGRNGAGKSRTLEALTKVVGGESDDGALVGEVRNADELAARILDSTERFLNSEGREWSDNTYPWRTADRTGLDRALGDWILSRWAFRPSNLPWRGTDQVVATVEEILASRVMIARMRGNECMLDLAVRIGPDTPLLQAAAIRVAAAWSDFIRGCGLDPGLIDASMSDVAYLAEQWPSWDVGARLDGNDLFTMFGPFAHHVGELWLSDNPDLYDLRQLIADLRGAAHWALRLRGGTGVIPISGGYPVDHLASEPIWSAGGVQLSMTNGAALALNEDLAARTFAWMVDWGREEANGLANRYDELEYEDPTADDHNYPKALRSVVANGDEVEVAPWVANLAAELSGTSSELLGDLVEGAPTVVCSPNPPEAWGHSGPLCWYAVDPTGANVPLAQLSGAQKRLAGYAIALTMEDLARVQRDRHTVKFSAVTDFAAVADDRIAKAQARESTGSALPQWGRAVFVFDEPEVGLHSAAEQNLAPVLAEFARARGIAILAATHSRFVLGEPDIHLCEVFRSLDGLAQCRSVEFPTDCRADVLGVTRADLLQLYRIVLLVEGTHDEVVLDELIGRELKRRGALVIPLRGGRRLASAADSRLIADTLTVPVMAVLDNTQEETIDRLWNEMVLVDPQSHKAVAALIDRLLDRDFPERDYIVSYLHRIHQRGELGRFRLFGLSETDVIDYLPVEAFVPSSKSWTQLRAQHDSAVLTVKGTPKDFKAWLSKKYKVSFDEASLRSAARALTIPPPEFLELLDRIDHVLSPGAVGGFDPATRSREAEEA